MSNYAFMLDKSSCDPKDRLMMSWCVRQSVPHRPDKRMSLDPNTTHPIPHT